ncbi:Uncharacterised protein [Shigella flexneri]|nr:Uncharacterised protein [Shigella flexneri]
MIKMVQIGCTGLFHDVNAGCCRTPGTSDRLMGLETITTTAFTLRPGRKELFERISGFFQRPAKVGGHFSCRHSLTY